MATKVTGVTTATGFSGVSNDENVKKPPRKVVMNAGQKDEVTAARRSILVKQFK